MGSRLRTRVGVRLIDEQGLHVVLAEMRARAESV